MSDSEVSKVVDYNGQPLLVHHTGSNKIDVSTKGKETGAMYFASNIETSKTYNGFTSHYFVNIRNPKIFDANTYEYTKLYDVETGDFFTTDTAPRLFKEKKGNDGVIAIGSGGSYALAAAKALVKYSELTAQEISTEALKIAADICVFTNNNITVEFLD